MNLKKSDEFGTSWPLPDSFLNSSPNIQNNVLSTKCPTHPRFELTNICMSHGCVEPLCPECFKHHLKIHNDIQTVCNSETLVAIRENCQENVQNLLNEFLKEKQRLNSWVDKKVSPHEEMLLKINQAKENLLNMVYKFFEFVEKNVNSYVQEYRLNHQDDFDNLSNKINILIEDLQGMQIELNGSDYIKCMLKMLMQGFNSDLESLKRDISQAFELWETNSNNFIIDDTKLYSINLELMKYIKINEGNSPNQPNKTNLMPTQEMNRVNLNKDYKKENVQGLEKYKNFQKYLEYTKSPIKLKKPQTLVENLNQRDLMQSSRQNLESITLEQTQENRVRFECPNYFQEQIQNKYLFFFQDNSKKFHYLDMISLEKHDIKYKFYEQELLIDFKIPLYHRSVITPEGEIYLIGGIDPNHKTQAINKVYLLDFKISTLIPKASLTQARYSHSVCFANKYIFVAGGVNDINDGYLDSFEKYDINFGEWIPLTACNNKSMGSSLCNYRDKVIYQFGGKMDNTGYSNYIERYDIDKDKWSSSIFIKSGESNFKLPSFANSYQINKDEILVFGGSINEQQCRSCYLLRIKEFIKNNEVNLEERFKEIKMEINSPGSFWNQPLMLENILFNVQNIVIEKGKELCHFSKKRAIICNSEIWKDL